MLSHPVLKELLPVTKAAQLTGTPLPGVFAKAQPLAVTSLGTQHPATRLITVPEVSARVWSDATQGDGALATKFCYPVQDVKSDWQVLVNCEAAATLPAIIATLPGARQRVYWMGNVDFSRRAHYVREKDKIQKLLVNHALVWLTGQAPE